MNNIRITEKSMSKQRIAKNEGTINSDSIQERNRTGYSKAGDYIRNSNPLDTRIQHQDLLLQNMASFNWTSEGTESYSLNHPLAQQNFSEIPLFSSHQQRENSQETFSYQDTPSQDDYTTFLIIYKM